MSSATIEKIMMTQSKCHFCDLERHDECCEKDADGKLLGDPRKCTCWACFGMYQDPTEIDYGKLLEITEFKKQYIKNPNEIFVLENALRAFD